MKWLNMIGEWQRRGLGFILAGLTLIGGLFTTTGCGSGNGTASNDQESADRLAGAKPGVKESNPTVESPGAGQSTVDTPDNISATSNASVEGSEWLEQQVRKAAELRGAGEYLAEAQHWKDVVSYLERTIGAGNWITAGARLSRQVAVRLSELEADQIQEWKQFEKLEQEYLQNRGEMTELRVAGRVTSQQYLTATQQQLDILDKQAAIVQKLFGQPTHLLANLAEHQAETLMSVEQWESASIAAERCLSLRQTVIQVRHPDTVSALKMLGQIAQQMKNDSLAEDCLVKATQFAEQVWGIKNIQFATCANDLGVFYYSRENSKPNGTMRDFTKANYWLDRGLQIRREVLGDGHRLVALSRRNYALSKMAEAATKPADRQALDLALANSLLSLSLENLRQGDEESSRSLQWQVLSEAATVKMLLHEYAEAETLLAEIAERWQKDPSRMVLPMTPATLFYRWGLASAKQRSPHKLVAAGKLMQQSIRYAETANEEKTAISAKQALARLQEISREGLEQAIPDRAIAGTPGEAPATTESAEKAAPVRVVTLPPVDDQN
ncbi:MAG: tetratricopeptide repeat protein [Planctomycetaceae bacterium]|nr:tetratricopeptide repeat protein [Planctomycetaceae bacterium]